jgi:hypothetical protein
MNHFYLPDVPFRDNVLNFLHEMFAFSVDRFSPCVISHTVTLPRSSSRILNAAEIFDESLLAMNHVPVRFWKDRPACPNSLEVSYYETACRQSQPREGQDDV